MITVFAGILVVTGSTFFAINNVQKKNQLAQIQSIASIQENDSKNEDSEEITKLRTELEQLKQNQLEQKPIIEASVEKPVQKRLKSKSNGY